MKFKKIIYIAVIPLILLTACNNKVPQCSDPKTLSLMRKLILKWAGGIGELEDEDVINNIRFEYPLASSFDEKIKKYTCTALLEIGREYKKKISYISQLDDNEEKHIIAINVNHNDISNISSAFNRVRKKIKKDISTNRNKNSKDSKF